MRKISKKDCAIVRDEIIPELVRMKHRLGQLGFFGTMHQMDRVTQRVGYELIELAPWTDSRASREAFRIWSKIEKERYT